MALPNRLRSARMTNATLGSAIDDNVGDLEKALCDLLGIPIDTDIAASLFTGSAAGLLSILLQNASAIPTIAGQLQRNNTQLLWHNTERAVELQPAGEIKLFFRTAAPVGYLLMDGAAYSRTTYARLFAAIGILGGPGDGSTTFNVPDWRGLVPVGLKATDTDFDTIGKIGGAKTVTPVAHSHGMIHTHDGAATSDTPSANINAQAGAGQATSHPGHTHAVLLTTGGPSVGVTNNNTPSPGSVVQPYGVAGFYIST